MILALLVSVFFSGNALATAGLDSTVISEYVKRHTAQLAACKAVGSIKVNFVIGADGKVISAAAAESNLKGQDTESCVTGVFKAIVFPSPEGGGQVSVFYPLEFALGKSGTEKPGKKKKSK